MKALVIDDCPDSRSMVRAALDGQFEVVEAQSLGDAKHQIEDGIPDLILLDLGLPDGDGIDFCEVAIKDPVLSHIPLIMMTARSELKERLAGLTAGADDYITKPFHLAELRARIQAVLRRFRKKDKKGLMKGYEIQPEKLRVKKVGSQANTSIDLTPTEFKIFMVLAQNPGRVFSRKDLVQSIWQEGISIETRGIDSHVCHLRKKLGEDGVLIKSVYGKGYVIEN